MFSDYQIFYSRLRDYAIQTKYITSLTMSLCAQSATALLL
jgi:hypothetical protein